MKSGLPSYEPNSVTYSSMIFHKTRKKFGIKKVRGRVLWTQCRCVRVSRRLKQRGTFIRFVTPLCSINKLEWSVCSCLTQLILFDGRGVFALLPKVQLHVSAPDNSHLQVVHESLKSSYTRLNMGCVQCPPHSPHPYCTQILYNYFLRIHVQPEDGYCKEPKHVVVPKVVM